MERLIQLDAEMHCVSRQEDWTPLLRPVREFRLLIFGLSPYQLLLEEVKRLRTIADTLIATKVSDLTARLRTFEEHRRIIASRRSHDHGACLRTMRAHRGSTTRGPRQLRQTDRTGPPASHQCL